MLESQPGVERDPERDFEAAFAPVIEMPATAQASKEVIDVPVMEQEPMPPVAFMDETPAAAPIAAAPIAEYQPEKITLKRSPRNMLFLRRSSLPSRSGPPIPCLIWRN